MLAFHLNHVFVHFLQSSCQSPSCICAQPLSSPCLSTNYNVHLSRHTHSLHKSRAEHDTDYFLSLTATNKAGLQTTKHLKFTVDASPPTSGVVIDNIAGQQDLDFQNGFLHHFSWSGFFDTETPIKHYLYYIGSSCQTELNTSSPGVVVVSF